MQRKTAIYRYFYEKTWFASFFFVPLRRNLDYYGHNQVVPDRCGRLPDQVAGSAAYL